MSVTRWPADGAEPTTIEATVPAATGYRQTLTPQMPHYLDFAERGNLRWLPYLMYAHRAGYRSPSINTDIRGFRYTHDGKGNSVSIGENLPGGPVNVLAGSSAALGVGASSDAMTVPSLLWSRYAGNRPWLNLAGQSYSATQEQLVFLFHRHLLPQVEEVVILSGFDELALSRQPADQPAEVGGFGFRDDYVTAMRRPTDVPSRQNAPVRPVRRGPVPAHRAPAAPVTPLERAVAAIERNLATWRLLTAPMGTRISYVLQPMAFWVRDLRSHEEELLFDEADRTSESGSWQARYGEISTEQTHRDYAAALATACARQSVGFLDLNPVLGAVLKPAEWAYVDRAHYTDLGQHRVARLLAETLSLT